MFKSKRKHTSKFSYCQYFKDHGIGKVEKIYSTEIPIILKIRSCWSVWKGQEKEKNIFE